MTTDTQTNKKFATAKTIARFVATRAVGVTVGTVIGQNVTTDTKYQKLMVSIGGGLIASMVADKTWTHTEQQIDAIADVVRDIKFELESDTQTNN